MLKNKWVLALLILGLSGTVVYNIAFFANRNSGSSLPSKTSMPSVPKPPVEPLQNLNTIAGAEQSSGNDSSGVKPHPPISIEEIKGKAQKPVYLPMKNDPPTKRTWPQRDPFQATRQQLPDTLNPDESSSIEAPELPVKMPEDVLLSQKDPLFRVSAILVEKERRFALVNGYPKKIGTAVGSWRIVDIEPEYVVVQTPGGEKKVEILRQSKNEKQVLSK